MLSCAIAEGVQLRPLEPWQAEVFAAHVQDNRAHLSPWLPWVDKIVDAGSAGAWLQSYADKQRTDEGRIFGIWAGETLAGGVLFRTFDAEQGVCEIGCWLAAEFAGQGLMTRAAGCLVEWAFTERGMTRIEWRTTPENTRSIAVAERLGMTREGTLRQSYRYAGTSYDIVVLSLLAREWLVRDETAQ